VGQAPGKTLKNAQYAQRTLQTTCAMKSKVIGVVLGVIDNKILLRT
jgi:hypothetical protein